MKKCVASILAIAVVPSLLLAYPAVGGGRGLFRVQNALVEENAGLNISFHAIGRNPHFPDTTQQGWVADLIAPELSYTPISTKYVGTEAFASWGGVFQYPQEPGEDKKFGQGLHDLKAGAKLSIPVLPVLKLGFAGSYTFMSGRNDKNWLDPKAMPLASESKYTWTGLATLQFQNIAASAPNLMFNYGKINDMTMYGVGFELVAEGFALFTEARSLQPENSEGLFDSDSGEIRLTPGVAFGTGTSGLTLKAGYTFSWGPDAPNEAVLGLVIATPFFKRMPPEIGTIAGKVSDARTGQPLAAEVNFPENPKLITTSSDSATGIFKVEKAPAGVVVVEVNAEGYHRQAVPINVKGNTVSQYEFVLEPLVTYGVIAGIVTNATNNQPLEATIEFPGSDIKPTKSSPATGAFRIDKVPIGIYTITAEADEYFKASLTVQVEEKNVASPTFALKPLTMKSTLTGKVSDKKTGKPLVATISFPGSNIPEVKNDPETGVYKTDIPVGSYAAKVTAEGYIPQSAAVVLEENKPNIKDFELVKKGMSITLRGIYFDFNKAIIKLQSRPALEDAAKIMQDNPTIRVEIQGHTDNIGSDAYNQKLSERRAQSVVTYLVQNFGIDISRLTAKGYGESKPIASNDNAEGRALNRRVQFFIIGTKEK